MQFIVYVLSVLAFLMGCFVLLAAKGAIHEIGGFVLLVISAVLLSGGAIIGAIYRLTLVLEKALDNGTGNSR